MDIVISNASDTPIYRQIYEQIRAQILSGALESGACLPPIRTAAAELRISVITVKKAWEELERQGLIYGVTGKGSFVAPLHPQERDGKRGMLAEEQLKKDLLRYKTLGVTKQDLLALVDRLYED